MKTPRAVMATHRLEAFSDGVIAIIITIMVLELHAPDDTSFRALLPLLPLLLSYVLSFIYLGIYWNNHHHMFQAAERISGVTLWANLHLLFWLSLFPFVTSWVGQSWLAKPPVACYGIVLFMAAISYWILQRTIIGAGKANAQLARAVGSDFKGKLSPFLYLIAIPAAFFFPLVSVALYVAVAGMWLIPDPRIERSMARSAHGG